MYCPRCSEHIKWNGLVSGIDNFFSGVIRVRMDQTVDVRHTCKEQKSNG